QSLLLDGLTYIQDDVQLMHTSGQIAEASLNNETSTDIVQSRTLSNKINNIDEQSAATQLTSDCSSPQTSDIAPTVTNPTESTSQTILSCTYTSVVHVPKSPTAFDTSDESGEETGA
ncbi:unnamed protein product, partial [Rotaria sp. Silwood1]